MNSQHRPRPRVWAAGLTRWNLGEGVLPPRVWAGGLPGPLPSSHTQGWQAHSRRSHARAENSLTVPHLFPLQQEGMYLWARLSGVSTGTSITGVSPRSLRSERRWGVGTSRLTASSSDH